MKQGWSVTVEGRPAKPVDPEDVLEGMARVNRGAVVGMDQEGILSVVATFDERSADDAFLHMLASLRAIGIKLDVVYLEVQTEARQEAELAKDPRNLVGIAEIADLAGASRQRVFQMTANKGFPRAVVEVAAGRLWPRDAIETYLASRSESAIHRKTGGDLRRKVGAELDRKLG